MSGLKIESAYTDVIELEKRTYLPFILTSTCPKCGVESTRDLTEHYLSYPAVGRPERVTFYHRDVDDGGSCGNEWHEHVVIGLTLTEVKP